MGIIEDALARQATRPEPRRIDYARMSRVHPRQKAALTRAVRAYRAVEATCNESRWDFDVNDEALRVARNKVAEVCKAAVAEWNAIGAWPDDWSRWQVALDDTTWPLSIDIGDL